MPEFRSGFVAVIGRPNVGKSTLINALLGQKVAAVSPRPQTTRRRQLGILTTEAAQLILVDTPGIHQPRNQLGQVLKQEVEEALRGIDVVLWLVDAAVEPSPEDLDVASRLDRLEQAVSLVLTMNKSDLLDPATCTQRAAQYGNLLHHKFMSVPISALRGDGLQDLTGLLIRECPVRPAEYDAEQLTDLFEREIAADLIRESALILLRDEVPHAMAVLIDEFKERANGAAYIAATMLVERESQKGIVIGSGGKMLKQIGTRARREIEAMVGRKVFLEVRVKVEKDWRNNDAILRRLGYKRD